MEGWRERERAQKYICQRRAGVVAMGKELCLHHPFQDMTQYPKSRNKKIKISKYFKVCFRKAIIRRDIKSIRFDRWLLIIDPSPQPL
jgi:hypothetical protein